MKKKILLLAFICASVVSCTQDNPSGPDTSDFDRQAMLVNWTDNIIIPAYTSFSSHTEKLKKAAGAFAGEPTMDNLSALRSAWLDAYLAWQHVSIFEIGKAAEVQYRNNLNIYPTNATKIEENISGGSYNLELPSAFDEQGFPALDYLLYGIAESDTEILATYTTGPNATGYRTYLTDLATRIDDLTDQVLNAWTSGYRDEFVQNNGSSANASVDMLVNDYIYYYEKNLRAGKIGIPAGVFSGSSLSSHVEAYYKQDISKALFLEALNATQDFFNGKHYGSETRGESLKSYLDFLNTMKDGADLSRLINEQFEMIKEQAATLNDNFVQQIEENNTAMLATYDTLQVNVILLKVDMLQALGINVDYVDADGD